MPTPIALAALTAAAAAFGFAAALAPALCEPLTVPAEVSDAVITRRCALPGADFYLLQDMPERHVWWFCYGRLTLCPGTILDRPDTMSIRAHYGPLLLYSRNILLLDKKDIGGGRNANIL